MKTSNISNSDKVTRTIRRRVMYGRWLKLYQKFRSLGLGHERCAKALDITFGMIEEVQGHGSMRAAHYSKESLLQVCEDMKRRKK